MNDAEPWDVADRKAALDRYDVLDTGPEARFDNITALVRAVLGVPIAVVSLVDRDRQWYKSRDGLDDSEMPREISFCADIIRDHEPKVVPDTQADPRFRENPLVTGEPHIRSYAGVPLVTPDGCSVGTLCAIDHVPRAFTEAQVALLQNFAAVIVDELELRQIAQVDFLTGALTRRAFVAKLDAAIDQRDQGGCHVLLVLDIDHFKAVNDRFGHAAGDRVLEAVAQRCRAELRSADYFGRLGGEEFACLLTDTDVDTAIRVAERCRRAVAALEVNSGVPVRVTASFGAAALGDGITDVSKWLAAADAALYTAKASGRDCCRLARPRAVAA